MLQGTYNDHLVLLQCMVGLDDLVLVDCTSLYKELQIKGVAQRQNKKLFKQINFPPNELSVSFYCSGILCTRN